METVNEIIDTVSDCGISFYELNCALLWLLLGGKNGLQNE